jgi:hypothetical protein
MIEILVIFLAIAGIIDLNSYTEFSTNLYLTILIAKTC